jgi:ribosomal-protein-alanine N-acetyltransferase
MIRHLALRLATADEAPAIARLSRDRIERGLGWTWTTPRVTHSIDDAQTNVLVAIESGRLLGFGIMKYRDEEAHLLLLAVRASAARRGIGTALVAWLEHAARVAGIGLVRLESRAGNADARGFYRGLGYREVQTVEGYYGGRESCVRLAKDLWLDA